MVGYVRWEEKRKKLTLRRCPLGDGEVCLLEGGGRLNRRVQRRVRQAALYRLPVWDFYAAAGGDGAMGRWADLGIANADRVHLSREGYRLQGKLFYDAIMKAYDHYRKHNGELKILLN